MADKKVSILYELIDKASAKFKNIQYEAGVLGLKLQDTQKKTKAFASDFETIGKTGKAVALAMAPISITLGLLGTAAIRAAGDFEQQQIAFTTMTGSAERANKLLKELKQFAAQTPFEYTDVVEYSKRLMAMGVETNDVKNSMKILGDIAAGVGTEKLPQLVLAFGQVATKTKLTGGELKQFSEAGVPLISALADKFGVAESKIIDMASAGEISFQDVRDGLESMTTSGGKFENLMSKQMETVGGKVSNLKDSFGFLLQDIGASFLPITKKVTDALIRMVSWFTRLDGSTKKIIIILGTAIFSFATLATGLGTLLAILPALNAGLALIGVTGASAFGWVGAAALGITAVTTALMMLRQKGDEFSKFSNKIKNESKENLIKSMQEVAKEIQQAQDSIKRGYNILGHQKQLDEALNKMVALKDKLREIEEQEKKGGDTKKKIVAENKKGLDELLKLEEYRINRLNLKESELLKAQLNGLIKLRESNIFAVNEQLKLDDLIVQKKNEIINKTEEEEEKYIETTKNKNKQLKDNFKENLDDILSDLSENIMERNSVLNQQKESALKIWGEESDQYKLIVKVQNKFEENEKNKLKNSLIDIYTQAYTDGRIGQAIKDFLKKELIAWGAAESAKATMAGIAAAIPTFGGSLLVAAGQVASIAANVGLGMAALDAIPAENGAIIGGNSFTGDKIPARVNTNEIILNPRQQANILFQIANSGKVDTSSNSSELISVMSEIRDILAGPQNVNLTADGTNVLAKAIWDKNTEQLRNGYISRRT